MSNTRSWAFLWSSGLCHSFGIRHSAFGICFIRQSAVAISLWLLLSLHGEPPPAKDILASVRMIESQQHIDLQGQLRQNDIVVPFGLIQNGPLIRYSFTNPSDVLQLRLG